MEIKIRNKNGIILQTKDKICDDNITIKLDKSLIPSGTLDITENGEHIVTDYEKVNVQVESGVNITDADATPADVLLGKVAYNNTGRFEGTIETYDYSTSTGAIPEIDRFLQGEVTELYNDRVTSIIANRCETDKRLVKIDLPNATTIGNEAFKECTNLASINLPLVNKIGTSAFATCTSLEEVDLPKAETIGASAFTGCSNLKKVNFPLVTTLSSGAISGTKIETISLPNMTTVTTRGFTGSSSTALCYLKTIYIPNATACQNNAFYRAMNVTAIIITQTEKVCTLPDAVPTTFKYAYHYLGEADSYNNPDGLKDGYIYVDKSMIEQYKIATNWSVLADQFKTLEEIPQEIKEALGI